MERWVGKVAVVTGASAGIGAAITEALVNEGLLVVGLARRLERLEKLSESFEGAKGKFYARECDVGKEEELLNALEWVNTELGGIDILVNNAGLLSNKRAIDDDIESYRNMMNVNFMATAISLREAVASMRSRKVAGHIININSILGRRVVDAPISFSLYPSTKHAVTALTETVRKELALAKTGIKITSLSPGVVATEIFETAGDIPQVDKIWKIMPHLTPKNIADAVVYILGTPENVQISEFTIQPVNEVQ